MGVVSNLCTDTGSRFGSNLWLLYEYTFSNTEVYVIGPKQMPSLAEGIAECDALIPTVETMMLDQSLRKTKEMLMGPRPGAVEDVIPTFPDELPASDPDVAVDTRQRTFHRWLVREVWLLDLVTVEQYLGDLWLWLEQMTNPNLQTYLAVDLAISNEISQRMGNAITVGGLVDADNPTRID